MALEKTHLPRTECSHWMGRMHPSRKYAWEYCWCDPDTVAGIADNQHLQLKMGVWLCRGRSSNFLSQVIFLEAQLASRGDPCLSH